MKTSAAVLIGLTLPFFMTPAFSAEEQLTPQQIEKLLRRVPDADLNKDGSLTRDEFREYRQNAHVEMPKPSTPPAKVDGITASSNAKQTSVSRSVDITITPGLSAPVNPRIYGIVCAEMFRKDFVDNPEYVDALVDLKFKTLLYPGGSVSYYHHPNGTGGFNIRPDEADKSGNGKEMWMQYASGPDHLDQYIQIVKASDGEAVFVANVLHGTAAELDEFLHRLQAADVPVACVLLGQEMHLGPGRALGLSGYIQRILPLIDLLESKYPDIPIVAPATPVGRVGGRAQTSFHEWNQKLAGLLGITGFSQYGWTEFGGQQRLQGQAGDAEAMTPEEIWRHYDQFVNTFPTRQIEVYQSDWGADKKMYMTQWGTHADRNTPLQGLHIANFYFFMAEYNVSHDDYFAVATSAVNLTQDASKSNRGGGVIYKKDIALLTPYLYTKPFRHLFSGDKKLLAASIRGAKDDDGAQNVKALAAAAPDNQKYLYIINSGAAIALNTVTIDGVVLPGDSRVKVEAVFADAIGTSHPATTFVGEKPLADIVLEPWSLTLIIPPQEQGAQDTNDKERKRERNKVRSDRPEISPTFENISYGSHERLVLDIWKVESDKPTPALVFLHGGGGEKSMYRSNLVLKFCLENGITPVSVNYRPNNTYAFPVPMLDCGRAIQFLRYNAKKYNIDPDRIAAKGTSLGANTSTWLAYHDDIADPDSEDPVLRESSRLSFVVSSAGQTFNDMVLFRQRVYPYVNKNIPASEEENETKRKFRYEMSAINFVTKDDPPIFMTYGYPLEALPLPENTPRGVLIHNPAFGLLLKEKLDEVGIENHFYHGGNKPPQDAEEQFILKHFFKGEVKQ